VERKIDQVRDQVAEPAQQAWDKVGDWSDALVANLPNIVVAILVMLLAFGLSLMAVRIAKKASHRWVSTEQLSTLIVALTRMIVLAVGLFLALEVLKLGKAVTSLLAGIGVLGIALGFAFQDIAANFMSGVILSIRHPFEIGDIVELDGHFGTVEQTNLRATVLRLFSGQTVILPNKSVLQNAIKNYSSGERRVELDIGVSYCDDLEKVERVALEAVDGLEGRDPERDAQVLFVGFGSSSIDFSLRFWTKMNGQGSDFLIARSKAVIAIKKAFDREGITIPFPIRTLDFGEVGGEKLADVIPKLQGNSTGKSEAA
jgi:small conductance mechanosensitive channel